MKNNIIFIILLSLIFSSLGYSQKTPKYVFVFIGDGMGVGHVQLAQGYAGGQSNLFQKPLLMTTFPAMGLSRTQSANAFTTDSAAGGTALATGRKTNNGHLSLDPTRHFKMTSLASLAKKEGRKVGIVTTDSIVGATPASFYASQPNRGFAYPIAHDLIQSDFDLFYSVGDFYDKNGHHLPQEYLQTYTNLMPDAVQSICFTNNKLEVEWKPIPKLIEASTYKFIDNAADFFGLKKFDDKLISIFHIPLAINAVSNSITLADITKKSIEILDNDKGFFVMIESSYIDKSGHANDGAMAAKEVIDLDNAILQAYKFYQKHPKETLIVVTADHETGGLVLGTRGSDFGLLDKQKNSYMSFYHIVEKYRQEHSQKKFWSRLFKLDFKPVAKFSEFQPILTEYFSFGDKAGQIKLSEKEWANLEKAFYDSIYYGYVEDKSPYGGLYPVSVLARKLLNKRAGAIWGSFGHSGIAVPIFAVGVGAEQFDAFMENTELATKISNVAFPKVEFPIPLVDYPFVKK